MKELQTREATIHTTLGRMPGATKLTGSKRWPTEARYTLRVEGGMLKINNISGQPEKITYTLMAQAADGYTTLIARDVSLAPFQVVEDQVEGMNVLAAWAKN